jgi:sn-glycerol 3-phosphate transport system ATP-binding protein
MLLGFRPEDIQVSESLNSADRLLATVDWVERLGPEAFVHVKTSAHAFKARVSADCSLSSGQEISLSFITEHAHFFEPAGGKRVDWLHATSESARIS